MHVLLLLLVPVQPMKQGDKEGRQKRERGKWSQEKGDQQNKSDICDDD